MNQIAPYAKSIVAAIVAGLGSLYQALDGDQSVTTQEWIAVAMTTLTALGVVFAVPNNDPAADHQDESVRPPEHGEASVVTVLAVVVLVLLVLFLLGFLR